MTTDLTRPYRGFGAINATWGRVWNGYHSIQTTFNRRFRNGVQATLNWTIGLRTIGNTSTPQRLQHNADGTFEIRSDQAQLDDLLRDTGNRRHVITGNVVWDLPDVRRSGMLSRVMGAVANDWQISGVFTGVSGARDDATYSYQTNGANVNLTGSPSYAARIRVIGDPGSWCSSNPYAQFTTSAYAAPGYNSAGLESGANLLGGCFDKTTDLSIARNIRLRGGRQAQLRVEMFNGFNTVVIDGRVTRLQLTNPSDPTVRNNQYNPDGPLNSARLTPRNAGFGAATSAQATRSIQVQLRFQF